MTPSPFTFTNHFVIHFYLFSLQITHKVGKNWNNFLSIISQKPVIWTEVCQAFALMVQYFHQAAFLLFKVQVSKEKRSCWILTDLCIESSLSVAGQVRVSWRRAEPFVWCFRIWENKHGDCTLIRDRNVAFTSIVPEPATPQSMTLHYMVDLEFLIIQLKDLVNEHTVQ